MRDGKNPAACRALPSQSSPSNLFFGNQRFLGMSCPSDVLEIMGQKMSALFCALWGQEGFWGADFGARVGRW